MLRVVVRVREFSSLSLAALIFACGGSVRHVDDGSGGVAGSGGSGGRFISAGGKGPWTGGSVGGGEGGIAGIPGVAGIPGEGGVPGKAGSGGAVGATCFEPDGLTITSAAELEAFAARGCVVFDGTLSIDSPDLAALDSLSPSPLRVITGALVLTRNAALTNIEGFSGLEEIHKSLVFSENALLSDLGGLETLFRVGTSPDEDTLVITSNPSLQNVEALGNAVEIRAGTVINGNSALDNLIGLGGLIETSAVTIAGNEQLRFWGEFGRFASATAVTIASNPKLESIFMDLESAEFLSITGNDSLVWISLPELATVQNLTIASNAELMNLGSVDALTSVGSLTIAANPKLSHCVPEALAARLNVSCSCGDNDQAPVCF